MRARSSQHGAVQAGRRTRSASVDGPDSPKRRRSAPSLERRLGRRRNWREAEPAGRRTSRSTSSASGRRRATCAPRKPLFRSGTTSACRSREQRARFVAEPPGAASARPRPNRAATRERLRPGRVRDLTRAVLSANDLKFANSRARPSRTAFASAGSSEKSTKNRNGVEAPHSSPMNSSGICGERSRPARRERQPLGPASAVRRSPKARLPIWSWFCRKPTKAVGGRCAEGSPRGSPPGARTLALIGEAFGEAARRDARPAGRRNPRSSRRSRRSASTCQQ